jgi:5-methylcytosine-specific restriction endonuclease McrBC regulatory subunit McrC
VDVKVKHVSATRRIPLMSVHTKDGFQMVNYCETEKEEFLKQEVMELTELKKAGG